MRLLFWVAVLFAGAVGLALFTQFNHSNVVLFYPPYRVEMSLNLTLALLLLLFFVVWTVLTTFRHLSEMPRRAAAYRERSRMSKAQAALRESIENLFAGRFARAERARDAAGMAGAGADRRPRGRAGRPPDAGIGAPRRLDGTGHGPRARPGAAGFHGRIAGRCP